VKLVVEYAGKISLSLGCRVRGHRKQCREGSFGHFRTGV
jgi:hypothetical protein